MHCHRNSDGSKVEMLRDFNGANISLIDETVTTTSVDNVTKLNFSLAKFGNQYKVAQNRNENWGQLRWAA